MACSSLVDLSYGSASEHEESEGEQEYPLQGQVASTEQAAPCAEDASQSRHDDDHPERQHHEDEGRAATTRDAPVPDCVASVHGQVRNLMPELPTNLVPDLATRRKRPAYALSPADLPPGLRVFLDGVASFFTRTVNLERQSQAVAQSTFLKARERMLCKSMNRE